MTAPKIDYCTMCRDPEPRIENAPGVWRFDGRDGVLNRRGRAAHIEPFSLFMGPWSRVEAYASEELLEWFATHGRVTFEEFERQRLDALRYEEAAGW